MSTGHKQCTNKIILIVKIAYTEHQYLTIVRGYTLSVLPCLQEANILVSS